MKKILLAFLAVGLLLAGTVSAQEEAPDLPKPGITPDSFLYSVKTFFEDMGTVFTFGTQAKLRRLNRLSEKRIAEVQKMSEKGKTDAAQKALNRYEKQMQKVKEKIKKSSGEDKNLSRVQARVASSTSKHFVVLERVLNKAPKQAQKGIENALEASQKGHKQALESLSKSKPERAAKIALQEMNRKAERIREAAEEKKGKKQDQEDKNGQEQGKPERLQKMAQEFEEYTAFGQEISRKAQGLRSGTTTVDELIEKATQHHLQVLQSVSGRVPEQARQAMQKAQQSLQEMKEEAEQSRERERQREEDTLPEQENPNAQNQAEQKRERTQEEVQKELNKIEEELEDNADESIAEACANSGGEIATRSCCKSAGSFPNTCNIGACGCALEESHEVEYCDCGEGKCFNGSACVAGPGNMPGTGGPGSSGQ